MSLPEEVEIWRLIKGSPYKQKPVFSRSAFMVSRNPSFIRSLRVLNLGFCLSDINSSVYLTKELPF